MNEIKKLMDEIKEQCGDCEAWSGTDCTRNPYTQGCLKDEKQVDELKERNYWLESEHEYQCEKSYFEGVEKGREQSVKDTAKEIYGEIDKSDILVVQTQEYGEIEVVPIERLKEIIKRKGVEVE